MKSDIFINYININSNILSIDRMLDYVFDTIDDLLLGGEFDVVDEILFNIGKQNIDISVGILTITTPFQTKLQNRSLFFNMTESSLLEMYGRSRTDKILGGLK